MVSNKSIFVFFAVSFVVLMNIQMSQALCCPPNVHVPFGCCATGACNILCCNCDGECLPATCGDSSKLTLSHKSYAELNFDEADTDLDGKISGPEAIKYLVNQGHNETTLEQDVGWFVEMDKNRDGFLEKNEIGI